MARIDIEVLARTAYNAYRNAQKKSVPPWDDLTDAEQLGWKAAVSAVTARFQFAHGYWYVEDLNSTNGTWLNGRRMFSAQRLKKGDKVRIGRTTVTIVSA